MIKLRIGKVKDIVLNTDKKQILIVTIDNKDVKAINYLELNPILKKGDKVVINRTATHLKLGTGGFDFVVSPITNVNIDGNGHIMKLKYTPYQFSVESCEEQTSLHHNIFTEPKFLEGLPVIVGELHSMLPVLVTVMRQLEKRADIMRKKIVYIMTDGGALPIAFSEHVLNLKKLGWLDATITVGNSFGGDIEAVNIYSGLIAAKHICNADVVIVLMGPGIVGTGSWMGFSGVEQGMILNAVSSLSGLPIFITRASQADKRERHRGISHHSLTILKHICLEKCTVPYPSYITEKYPNIYNDLLTITNEKHDIKPISVDHQEVEEYLTCYNSDIHTMNRDIDEDRLFFDFVASVSYYLYN